MTRYPDRVWRRHRRGFALVLVLAIGLDLVLVSAAGAAKKPRVEDVAVAAVVLLGEDAPRAVLEELDAGTPLARVVKRIRAGSLEAPKAALGITSWLPALGRSVGGSARVGGSGSSGSSDVDYPAIMNALTLASLQAAEVDPDGDVAQEFREDLQENAAAAEFERAKREASIADPYRILERAQRKDADPGAALFVNAILMAANNGYDVDQITDYLLDEILDPALVPTDEGLLSLRGPFLFGGFIAGVEPNGDAGDVFRVARSSDADSGSQKQKSDREGFVGELALGANWADTQGVGTPTVAESRIQLRIEDERLVGTYVLKLDIPEPSVNCATTATYEGTLDLPPEGPGWTGSGQGTWTWTLTRDRPCGSPPGVYGLNWQVTVLQVANNRLSGDFSKPTDGQGMTMTFEARAG